MGSLHLASELGDGPLGHIPITPDEKEALEQILSQQPPYFQQQI
jgi:hypothetical protein